MRIATPKVWATWKTPRQDILAACVSVLREFDIAREDWDEECAAMADIAAERVMLCFHGRPDAAAGREMMARIKTSFAHDLRKRLEDDHEHH